MSAGREETVEEVEQRYKRVVMQMNDLYDEIFRYISRTAATDPLRAEGMLVSLREGRLAANMLESFWTYDEQGNDFWAIAKIRSNDWLWLCSNEYIDGVNEGRTEVRSLGAKLARDGHTWDFIKQAMLDENLYEKLVDEYGIRNEFSNSNDDE